MARLLIAITATAVLTLAPKWFQAKLRQCEPADFPMLVAKLQQVRLCPDGWEMREAHNEFDDRWKDRLGLQHYRSVELTTNQGEHLTVLVMLSETGEQLYHTPAICYAAHGCEVRGSEVAMALDGQVKGEARAVEVRFNEFASDVSRTAAFTYWVSPEWKSPPLSSMLNNLGREPFLLKIQLLLENSRPGDAKSRLIFDEYLSFLGDQLRRAGIG